MTHVDAQFGCESAAAGAARATVDAALRVWHLDDLAGVATLLTSELVTNAVLHARTDVRVVARHTPGEVIVLVFDGSDVIPSPSAASPEDEGGRGLLMVQHLSRDWGVERTEQGKVVWFALSSP